VFTLVNAARRVSGLAPLAYNTALERAGQSYAETMASTSCFDHTCGPVPDFTRRAEQAGYTPWTRLGENIAWGYRTADEVFNAWMNSPSHREHILEPAFRDMGLGVAYGGSGGIYWSQEFGSQQ
jgi:uncharacterized protein YkwD